jgi:hypothetical protein
MELTTAEPNAFLSSLANSERQGEDSRQYNITDPSFYDRVRLYLKPTEVGEFWVFLILISDWMLAALFVGCQFHYILNGEFSNMS